MRIKRKQWIKLAKRVKALENEVDTLRRQLIVKTWSHGEVTFGDFVKITEKEINRLKEACELDKAVDKN